MNKRSGGSSMVFVTIAAMGLAAAGLAWIAVGQRAGGEAGAMNAPGAVATRRALGPRGAASGPAATAAASENGLVAAARGQIGVTTSYDPAYRVIAYPNGDVPSSAGVCTDVVIRALRVQGVDLQKGVHEDMAGHFGEYPKKWGLTAPDKNIDHRRVPNLMTYFKRRGYEVPISKKAEAYAAGDVVTWDLGGGLVHTGIVSDRKSEAGMPLIIHNIGRGVQEQDVLFGFEIIGHYRIPAGPATRGHS